MAQTLAPSDVTNTSATLHGTVDADRRRTTYWFEIGPTTAYGAHTQAATTDKKDPVDVQSSVSGLTKGAVYHVRLVARNDDGLSLGADLTFTASAAGRAHPCAPATSGAARDGWSERRSRMRAQAPRPPSHPPRRPSSARASASTSRPGACSFASRARRVRVPVTDAASVPVGSIVDARKGTVALSSAVPGDASQTGTFHGGLFQVRQPAGARGMTELVLRGPLPVCTGGGARAAAASAKRPPRALWGRDDHGRFRTRGSNSVATVRGTAWYVEDRCDGTLTRVSKGSVSVRDLHRQRTVIVNAGKSYLARPAVTR